SLSIRSSGDLSLGSVTGNTRGINYFVWHKGPITFVNYTILSYISDDKSPVKPGYLFHSRVTPFSNGSLQISNLNISDEGHYIVRIQAEHVSDTSVYLKIFDMVGKPTITTSTSHPKENDAVNITCTSTNAEMIAWSRVPSGATLSPDNRTVCFSMIKRSDSGVYRCQTNNPVSKANSDPITITVGYGPENIKVNTQRSPSNSFILLECSADSVPPATYQWRLNGIDINVQQNSFQVNLSKTKEERTYTCVANNSVTRLTAMDSIYVNVTIESTDDDDYNDYNYIYGQASGIGIGAVLSLVLVIVLAYFFSRNRRHKKCKQLKNLNMRFPLGVFQKDSTEIQDKKYYMSQYIKENTFTK
ncbi:cell adhesion molecule CEACAM2-like, partial [Lithobates pipiens]